jgi:retron-type reverse transcriptase
VFTIGKRGGGERTISSPRLFLKVVQHWLVDYVLYCLPQHPSTHAYRAGRSIVTNASQHVGQAYVGNVDIKDFFPSVRPAAIARLLTDSGLGPRLSDLVSRLTTLHGGLPQGAPTSPLLSNAFLFPIDELMVKYCAETGAIYTRYADDITISASSRPTVADAFEVLRIRLGAIGLQLNEAKTRIASRSGQQRVTGVVVNDKAQLPREFRRRVRAIFHQSLLDPAGARERLSELRGYVGYLKSFPSLRDSKHLQAYADAIAKLES